MKTDKWFYQLFLTQPGMLAELIPDFAPEWEFHYSAPVLKEREFRLEGLLCPQSDNLTIPLVFLEAQMQSDEGFYGRYFAEIFLYLQQYPTPRPWKGLLLLRNRKQRLGHTISYQTLLNSQINCFYLEDLLMLTDTSPNLSLLKILILEEADAFRLGQTILQQSEDQSLFQQRLNLLETILVGKFPHLGTEEILRMLDLKTLDVTQSRFYQEVVAVGLQQGLQQGRQDEANELILRQLIRKCGALTSSQVAQVNALDLETLERLGEDLLDFTAVSDLVTWLESSSSLD